MKCQCYCLNAVGSPRSSAVRCSADWSKGDIRYVRQAPLALLRGEDCTENWVAVNPAVSRGSAHQEKKKSSM